MYIHRPSWNFGPHASLFNPAFARLKYRVERLDDPGVWTPGLEADSELLKDCQDFMMRSCNIFEKEGARDAILNHFFESVFQASGEPNRFLGDDSAKPDVVYGTPPRVIREDKNEDGTGGNSTVQGTVSYRKVISQGSVRPCITTTEPYD